MPDWLLLSIILSVAGTVALNLALLAARRKRSREGKGDRRTLAAPAHAAAPARGRRVRMFFPWKWMLAASVIGTVLLNLAL